MSESPWCGAVRTALEVSEGFQLGDAARALLVEEMQPEQFLDALQAGNHWVDACRFLAHALPKRKAVLWACACLRQVLDPKTLEGDAALGAAERWVEDPSEESRRAAFAAAEVAEVGALGGIACLAAGVSGGSLAPPGVPPVPPGDFETAKAVTGVVLLAAVRAQPEKASEKFARFLELGKEIAHRPLPAAPRISEDAPTPKDPPTSQETFNHDASIARGWSETEAEHGESDASAAKSPPLVPPAKTTRPVLKPRSSTPLSRPRGDVPRKETKPTSDESIGRTSFEDE